MKKILIFIFSIILLFLTLTTTHAGFSRYVKVAGVSAVYRVDNNINRFVFPDQKTYEAYFGNNFSVVETISINEINSYFLKGIVFYPEGSLIKTPTDPAVYEVVDSAGAIKKLADENTARIRHGASWASKVRDISPAFFTSYAITGTITELSSEDSPFGAHGDTFIELADIGVKYKRNSGVQGLVWEMIDRDLDEVYDWTRFDENIAQAQAAGLSLMVTTKFNNAKDRSSCGTINPCDWVKYERFITTAAARYKNTIHYWQVENEVSFPMFFKGTPQDYAEVLARTQSAIKKGCPDCKVLVAGIPEVTESSSAYYKAVLTELKNKNCGTNCFDIFDLHVPPGHTSAMIAHKKVEEEYRDVLDLLLQTGFSGKPIWSTEFGPLSFIAANPGDKIENELITSFAVALELGYEKLFWRVSEGPSCVLDEGVKTNTYYAYKTLIQKIKEYSSVSKLKSGQYKFTFSDKNPVYIVWCEENCSLATEITGTVRVTSALGSESTKNTNNITLTSAPVFIEKL